jgi:hypothetical protein
MIFLAITAKTFGQFEDFERAGGKVRLVIRGQRPLEAAFPPNIKLPHALPRGEA